MTVIQPSVTNGYRTTNNHDLDSKHQSSGQSTVNGLDLTVLGMNSGTCLDGIDCALVRYRQETPDTPLHMELLHYDEIPVPEWIKSPILKMLRETKTTPSQMSQINVQLGMMFAEAVDTFCDKYSVVKSSIDLIGSHGQTIWLLSMPRAEETRSALCMGEGTVMSSLTGITSVTDFRMAEQAVGRQGAPLVALIDGLLLHHPKKWRICQNIGGIANLCIIPPDSEGGVDAMIDWDCGPGNMFIDNAMRYFTNGKQEYDRDGEWGARGIVDQSIVDCFLNSNWYVNHTPPKTTGRETFGDNEGQQLVTQCLNKGLSKYDTIATLTRITAKNIIRQYKTFFHDWTKIDEVFMCGGGARNPNIIRYLQQQLPKVHIRALDETGVPSDAKEAISFAQQAVEAVLGRAALVPINSDSLTPNTISGKIAPGLKWRSLMKMCCDFGGGQPLPTVKNMVVDKPYTKWMSMPGVYTTASPPQASEIESEGAQPCIVEKPAPDAVHSILGQLSARS